MHGDVLREFAEVARDDLGQLIAAASAKLMSDAFERITRIGYPEVHPAHIAVFTGLDPEGTRVSTLAARAGISRQAMSVLIRSLESAGYVTAETDPTDQRATLVQLDQRGVEFCRAAIVVAAEMNREIEQTLGTEDAQLIRSALRRLAG